MILRQQHSVAGSIPMLTLTRPAYLPLFLFIIHCLCRLHEEQWLQASAA